MNPPILPMLAKRVSELPAEGDWVFEPKWDGFRALVFRDGDEILIQSRDEKPLDRYFPELLEPLRSVLPTRCVLDGEMVIVKNDGLDFDSLQLRLHPAASRVNLLSKPTCFATETETFEASRFRADAVSWNRCFRRLRPPSI